MNFLRLLPVLISFLLIAAHFLRAGHTVVVVLLMALLLLLTVRNAWVPRVIQVILVLAAVEWLRTLFTIANLRMQTGEPWARMAMILAAVALFTALSGMVFRSAALRAKFSESKDGAKG